MTTFTPVAGNHAHAYRHSVPTLAAIGFLAYYVVTMCHEVLGHGVAFYMLGAHHFVLTSTSIDSSDTLVAFAPGTLGYRFICAAGSLSTILLGILLSANGEALTRVLAYLGAICTSFSFSVTFIPRCSRKNRISEDGSVEEYTPLT